MERLTNYEFMAKQYYPNENIDNEEIFNKLGKLEDIEDELGISLEVLFKALKDGVWVKEDIWNNNYKIINFGYVINEYCIYNNDFARSTKDYGKTWWLEKPKEELE